MPVPSPITKPTSSQDLLIRILAEMVYSAIMWEAEHPCEFPLSHNRLTEEQSVIHLIPTDLFRTDANSQSPQEGDTNVPA